MLCCIHRTAIPPHSLWRYKHCSFPPNRSLFTVRSVINQSQTPISQRLKIHLSRDIDQNAQVLHGGARILPDFHRKFHASSCHRQTDTSSQDSVFPASSHVVICGGGVIGCSVAYHLAKWGWTDVVLLEQGRYVELFTEPHSLFFTSKYKLCHQLF